MSIIKPLWEGLYWIANSSATSSLLGCGLCPSLHTASSTSTAKWKEAGTGSRQIRLGNTGCPSTCKISFPKIWHVNTGLPWLYQWRGINEWDDSGSFPHSTLIPDLWAKFTVVNLIITEGNRKHLAVEWQPQEVVCNCLLLHCGMGKYARKVSFESSTQQNAHCSHLSSRSFSWRSFLFYECTTPRLWSSETD